MVIVVCCNDGAIRKFCIDPEARACGTTERTVSADRIGHVCAKVHDTWNANAGARNGLGEDLLFKRKRMWIFRGGNAGLKLKGSEYRIGRGCDNQIVERQVFHL